VTTSARAAFTVSLTGDNTSINNAGLISGVGALLMNGDGYDLINSGTISGDVIVTGNFAAVQSSSATDTQISNSGLIAGNLGIIARADVLIQNSGTIQGANEGILINAGVTTDLAQIVNTGTIMGGVDPAIASTFFAVDITNLGNITGDIQLALRDDFIMNTGTIAGDVLFGGGADTFSNRGDGLVTGTIYGEEGNDTLHGGEADDVIDGGADNDIITGNSGEDTLIGDSGNDFIRGGADNDDVNGGTGDDTLRGDGGDDTINGGDNDDKIFGGSGDDEIIGGAGKDVMRGNAGADTFVFLTEFDANTTTAIDRIRDFEQGVDKIDISNIAGFEFIGDSSFSGTGSEVRYQTTASGLRFEMDVDGDGTADMRINVNSLSDLLESDFIL
jgi:Ca2+-binding RTX toxin-like protein